MVRDTPGMFSGRVDGHVPRYQLSSKEAELARTFVSLLSSLIRELLDDLKKRGTKRKGPGTFTFIHFQ
jgi:hypothetical protein